MSSQSNSVANRPAGASSAVRRRGAGSGGGGGQGARTGQGNNMSMLRYYTDDSPGLKITPVVVLMMSVCFIAFVTMLHAVSKIYQYTSK
mmetsp:Transcript_12212/g.45435  ORF Transcript_12212/g.45435 Transcript_12212/m.45435 type:complete len:89 (-) Transcript_12212:1078-1344(-)